MKKLLILIFLVSFLSTYAQEKSLKEQALNAFNKERYDEAITLLKRALRQSNNDPEIYYYLAMVTHSQNYDHCFQPKRGNYNSEEVFNYLDKAIELDSTYAGNSKFMYGLECTANAFRVMDDNDVDKLKYFYKKAYDKGAYPKWLIEFGYNMLISCEKDAILITGSNADFDVCSYLQIYGGYREDLTLINLQNIDCPEYIKFLKNGLEGVMQPLNINLTDEEINALQPVKWKNTPLSILYDRAYQRGLRLPADHKMEWSLEPDMNSSKEYIRIDNETLGKRQYLSPKRAMLRQIIQDNYGERKIFFSNTCESYFLAGLEQYTMDRGVVGELLPIKTVGTTIKNDYEQMEKLLTKANLKDYQSVKNSDIPRISGILYLYHNSLITLAGYYRLVKDQTALKNLMKIYTECLRGVNEDDDKHYPSVLGISYKNKR